MNIVITPLGGRVIVQRCRSRKLTSAGLIIPDIGERPASEGIVRAIGPGAKDAKGRRIAPSVKVGDRVLFGKFSGYGKEIQVDGQEMLMVEEAEIVCVIEQ